MVNNEMEVEKETGASTEKMEEVDDEEIDELSASFASIETDPLNEVLFTDFPILFTPNKYYERILKIAVEDRRLPYHSF